MQSRRKTYDEPLLDLKEVANEFKSLKCPNHQVVGILVVNSSRIECYGCCNDFEEILRTKINLRIQALINLKLEPGNDD